MKLSFVIFASLISFIFSFAKTPNTTSSLSQRGVDGAEVLANACLKDQSTNELFNQLASNIDDKTYIDNTYASYYFSNLRDNFGNNAFGSCGYVSIGMLLSFYDVYWDDNIIDSFPATIEITGIDQVGVLNQITRIISNDLAVNIRNLNIETNDGLFKGTISVLVHNIKDVERMCDNIKKIKEVKSATRIMS